MIVQRVYVSWDGSGAFTGANDNISEYVKAARWQSGIWDQLDNVARAGNCTITLSNEDRRFSLAYTAGALYGQFRPMLPLKIAVWDGSTEISVWRGVVTDFDSESGQGREATISGEDLLGVLSRRPIRIPARSDISSEAAIKLITSDAFRSDRATGSITLTANPTDGETVTVGDHAYTFEAGALDAAYKVLIGDNSIETAMNLAAAINAAQVSSDYGYGSDSAYGSGTVKHPDVTAALSSGSGSGGTLAIEPASTTTNFAIGHYEAYIVKAAQRVKVVSGILADIEFKLFATVGTPGEITWAFCQETGGLPGAELITGTFTPASATGWQTIVVTGGPTVYEDGYYWVTMRTTSDPGEGNYYRWEAGQAVDTYYGAAWLGYPYWRAQSDYCVFTRIITVPESGAVVALEAVARGAWGNGIALAESAAAITLSGATLSGGVDGPAGLIDCDTGAITISDLGLTWPDRIKALDALREVVTSEGTAILYTDLDGTITFKNRYFPFLIQAETDAITITGEAQIAPVAVSLNDIINRVMVRYTPGAARTLGVVARANSAVAVPGTGSAPFASGSQERHSITQDLSNPQNCTTTHLSFVDLETGQISGAEDLVLPLAAGTDYTVSDSADGGGFDYTASNRILASVGASGSGVDITLTNSATGTLHVADLQVRGVAVVSYDPVDYLVEDSSSIDDFGQNERAFSLPLGFAGIGQFAPLYAAYLMNKYSQPNLAQPEISFKNISELGGVALFGLGIGSVITHSDTQTGVSAWRSWIAGIAGSVGPANVCTLRWYVRWLDSAVYGIYDDPVFGIYDGCNYTL